MGNFTTREDQIEDITYKIFMTEKFRMYQEKFRDLTPSRDLYIEYGELFIETLKGTSYSLLQYEFDWFDPDVENKIYDILDRLYETYTKRIDNKIIYLETMLDKSIEEFEDWAKWLETYFHPDSIGYQLLKDMEKDNPTECNNIGSEEVIYPPQYIWYLMLRDAISNDHRIGFSSNPHFLERYHEPLEISVGDIVVAIIARIENKWWYVGITSECLQKVHKICERQSF